ncbi:MAG TPA: DUF3426 domain-containing protein [Rhizomicrobium sp.]|jgi:predicted Zn finger-like uncharacterized protein
MILTCPACQTRYRADAAQFSADGRKVRCAKCSHVWHQSAPEPEPGAEVAVPEVVETGISGGSTSSRAKPTETIDVRHSRVPDRSLPDRLGALAGWLALGAMVFFIGWTGFRFRQEITTLWPQSSSLFATFGVAVNARGIAIDDWSYHRETENGQPAMVVTGKLVNTSGHEISIPPVRVTLTDDNQRELYHWTFQPPQPTLKPGQSLGFSTHLSSPPPNARHLQLRFVSQD